MAKTKIMKVVICFVMVFSLSFGGLGILIPAAHAADVYGHADGCTGAFDDLGVCVDCGEYEPAALIDDATSEHDGYYGIGSYGNLMWFAEQINSYGIEQHKAVLTGDIYIGEEMAWEPINFYGDNQNLSVFDGDGHTITIFRNCDTGTSDILSHGLFDKYNYGVIEDLTLEGKLTVNSYGHVGALAAQAYRSTIRNVVSYVEVVNNDQEGGNVGGLVGYFGGKHENGMYSKIENCAVYADLVGYNVGGIVGQGWNGDQYYDITNVVFKGNITVHEGGVGGAIVGYHSTDGGTSTFTNVYWNEDGGLGFFGGRDTEEQVCTNTEEVTLEYLYSGALAYEFNNDGWGQKMGLTDTLPLPNSNNTVYYVYESCAADSKMVYSNTNVEKLFHGPDDNGCCEECGTWFGASIDGVCYETLADAFAVLAALDEIADGTVVKAYVGTDEAFEIPVGVIFDGNGNTFGGEVHNHGTIVGGVYETFLRNDGVIEKAVIDGWYFGTAGSLIRPAKSGDVVYGDNYSLFGNDGTVDCGEHIGGTATCDALAICEFCQNEYGEYLEHNADENGECTDCDYVYAAVVDGVYYDTLEEALEAAEKAIDDFIATLDELPSEAAIALGMAVMPRPEAEKRTVKLLKDADLAFEIADGVIFDGNGFEINSAGGVVINYGEIIGGIYSGVLYNYGTITKAKLNCWFCNYDRAELINAEVGAITFGADFGFFIRSGEIKCLAHFGGTADCRTLAKCEFCGNEYGNLGMHSTDAEGDREASCDELAYCSVCEKEYGNFEEHDFDEATCEVPEICSLCDEIEGEALEHDFADADCTTPKTCKICGETEGEALGHDYGDWVVTKEAKVGEAGEKTRECACGQTETEQIAALEPANEPAAQNEDENCDEAITEKPTEKATEKAAEKETEPAKKGCRSDISIVPAAFALVLGALIGTSIIPAIKRKRDQ